MDETEFKGRSKSVEFRAIRLSEICPKRVLPDVLGAPIISKAREFSRDRLPATVSRKIRHRCDCQVEHVEEEGIETFTAGDSSGQRFGSAKRMQSGVQEIDEMLAMTVASIKTLRARFFFNPKSKVRILQSQCAA